MNRKIALLMIAAITVILPAVAVADVMVTGQVSLESMHQHTAFKILEGPNYAAANSTNSIGWISAQNSTMGTIDLEGSYYVQTEMINVLTLNIAQSNPAAPATFMGLYLNVSSSSLPAGTIMAISTSLISFHTLTTTPVTNYSPGNPAIAVNAGSLSTVVTVDLSQNPHLLVTGFTPTQNLYLSFLLPPGMYAGTGALITGQFVAFA